MFPVFRFPQIYENRQKISERFSCLIIALRGLKICTSFDSSFHDFQIMNTIISHKIAGETLPYLSGYKTNYTSSRNFHST